MPRGNLNEVSKGGMGFEEGYIRIDRSVARIFQYPMNSATKEQSDAFPALVWEVTRLTPEWAEMTGETAHTEVVFRMGDLDKIHPGVLAAKDFDNLNVEPEDMGDKVGAEGNCFRVAEGAKFAFGWSVTKESLEKAGFKPDIMGRGILTDFEGTYLHMKTGEGAPYIAKQGKKKGEKVTPTNLVCDRIHVFGYDKPKGVGVGATGAAATATAAKPNGSAPANATGAVEVDEDARAEFCAILADPSDPFKTAVPASTAVDRKKFQTALTNELFRRKTAPGLQKAIMGLVKDDALLAQVGADTELYKTDGKTITLA